MPDISVLDSEALYPVTIESISADQFALWLEEIPSEAKVHSKFVDVWGCEIESFPKHMLTTFDYVDEVWAISSFVRDSIQPHARKPVLVFQRPIIAPSISKNSIEAQLESVNKMNLIYLCLITSVFSSVRLLLTLSKLTFWHSQIHLGMPIK